MMNTRSLPFAFVALLTAHCERSEQRPTAATSASPVASAAAPPAEPAKPKPWYEGSWTGTYQAAIERIELEVGGVRAWKDDDGKAASGSGTLKFSVSPEGVASGEAEGALGAQEISGQADDKGLWLTLAPKSADAQAFRGTLVAERAGQTVSGVLRASSGDSLTVRKAKVELRAGASP